MANRCFGPTGSIAPFLDHGITRFFMGDGFIDQGGKIIAEYVWIGGTMEDVRSKARTLEDKAWKPEDLPHWNYGERERRGCAPHFFFSADAPEKQRAAGF